MHLLYLAQIYDINQYQFIPFANHLYNYVSTTTTFLFNNTTLFLFLEFRSLRTLNRLSCSWVSRWSYVVRCLYFIFFCLYKQFLSCTWKNLLNIISCFGTSLKYLVYCMLLGKFNGSFFLNFSFLFHFSLVTNQIYFNIFRSVLLNFFKPIS